MITRKNKVSLLKKEIKLLDESMRISNNGKRQYLREKEILKRLFLNATKDNQLPTTIIKNLSEIFQRQPNAIRSQLRKEGLVKS